jgi:NADPH:quinone reductase-like Zn-dependent oxidoreductase
MTTTHQLHSKLTAEGRASLYFEQVELPELGADQVLIQVEAAPINPSDLALLTAPMDLSSLSTEGSGFDTVVSASAKPGAVEFFKSRLGLSLPTGNEGAGTVVAAGSSDAAQALLNKKVSAFGGAMYAQHRVANVMECLPLPEGCDAADGASSFVNPMTALGMTETMRMEGHAALIHTAAASNLGQMLNRICLADEIPLICIVRSEEQVALLQSQGAQCVINSSSAGFMQELTDACDRYNATLAFDATGGGSLGSAILNAMEGAAARHMTEYNRYGSDRFKQLYIYGGLDVSPTTLHRGFGFAWSISGWLLPQFLGRAGLEVMMRMRARVAAELTTTFKSNYAHQVDLPGALALDLVREYATQATGVKTLITP